MLIPRALVLLAVCFATAHAAGLNDTGITFCGNSDTTNSSDPVVCAAADSGAYPRQDLRYGRDAQAAAGTLTKVGSGGAGFDFTKIANNGSVLPASATLGTAPTDWACTKDNVTGLIWEVKTTSGLRSQSHTYTWYNSDPATNGGANGTESGGTCLTAVRCDTEKYTRDVNTEGLCNNYDWRMPTRKELVSIVDFGRVNPSIDPTYFPNTPASHVWSGSPYAYDASYAWFVGFYNGVSFNYYRGNGFGVRLVRGGQ
ncbi:MAG: hypothetical protein RIR79_910 [Pseudomonadota bacterium]|jgi:hypothetical protein